MPCSSRASAICQPTVRTGFSELIAPWNTIAPWVHRTARSRPQRIAVRSSPPSSTVPVRVALRGSSRRADMARVDFPQPDSPAMPTVPPGSTARSTPSTATTSVSSPRLVV